MVGGNDQRVHDNSANPGCTPLLHPTAVVCGTQKAFPPARGQANAGKEEQTLAQGRKQKDYSVTKGPRQDEGVISRSLVYLVCFLFFFLAGPLARGNSSLY